MLIYLLPLLGYLLGSISFSYHITKLLIGRDIREIGSKNAGAQNVMLSVGKIPGLLVMFLDIGKGTAAILIAQVFSAPDYIIITSSITAFLGHVFPFYLQFRGGKGFATFVGLLPLLAFVPGLICGILFFIFRFLIIKNSIISGLLAFSFLPFLVLYFTGNLIYFSGFLFLMLLRWLFEYPPLEKIILQRSKGLEKSILNG